MQASNNVVSNIGYIIFGIIHMITISRRYKLNARGNGTLPHDYGLHYAMGEALLLEGVFSSLYHLCPNMENYQFDTTFIIIGGGMLAIDFISKRNQYLQFDFFRVFGFFASLVALNSVQLRYKSPIPVVMWILSIFLFVWATNTVIINSLFPKAKFTIGIRYMTREIVDSWTKNKVDMILLIIANCVNITIFVVAYQMKLVFPTIFIGLLVSNIMIMICFYLFREIKSNRSISRNIWILLGSSVVVISASLVFFSIPTYIKFGTSQESRTYNKPCILFGYFDYHDMWHFLSALGMFLLLQMSWNLQPEQNQLQNGLVSM